MEIAEFKVDDLILDPANARKHNEKNVEAIKGSLARFGQQKPIVITKNKVVVAGNGTLVAARALGWPTVKAIVTELDGSAITAFGIADNRTAELGEWDEDVLENLLESLKAEDFDLGDMGFDETFFEDDKSDEEQDGEGNYTKKIKAPIYEPKGEKPSISDLVNCDYSKNLVKEIDLTNLPEDIKAFLKSAAARHNVFHYERIAEYYAHSTKEIQELMERSALVIIDFNKAIELGFVKLSEEIAEVYKNESE